MFRAHYHAPGSAPLRKIGSPARPGTPDTPVAEGSGEGTFMLDTAQLIQLMELRTEQLQLHLRLLLRFAADMSCAGKGTTSAADDIMLGGSIAVRGGA